MAARKITLKAAFPPRRAAGFLGRAILIAAICCCANPAWAKQKPKAKKSAHSSKKVAKAHVNPDETPLKPENYPAELGVRIADYNTQVKEINAIRKQDAKLAKARGEVL